MHSDYIGELRAGEQELGDAFLALAEHHVDEPDIYATAELMAVWCREHVQALGQIGARYRLPEQREPPDRRALFQGPRIGSYGLLHDLHDLWLLGQGVHLRWTVLGQVARALRDGELEATCADLGRQTDRQLAWLRTQIAATAPQALVGL